MKIQGIQYKFPYSPKKEKLLFLIALSFFVVFFSFSSHAQNSLKELIQISTENYPGIIAKKLETRAAGSNLAYERSDFIPQLSASYQANYSTANNITGLFLPGQVLPISGPPSEENSREMVSGSAAALLLNWKPITFGKRSSRVRSAKEQQNLAEADEILSVFEHQIRFVQVYLDYWEALAYKEVVENNLERYRFNLELSRALVINGIKPGVDSAQFRTLTSRANIELLNAKQQIVAMSARVRELLGVDDWEGIPDPVLRKVIEDFPVGADQEHPLYLRQQQQTAVDLAEKSRISRLILPDLLLWGSGFARGSAIDFDGVYNEPQQGMRFSRYNIGMGFQISMPLLLFTQNRHLVKQHSFQVAASEAYEEKVERSLERENLVAVSTLEASLEAAQLSPSYVEDARFSYGALKARYENGLINLSEFLQGQFDLVAAESEDIRIRSEMWKALLFYAAIKGNIEIFTQILN